jgi:hypothetical protein
MPLAAEITGRPAGSVAARALQTCRRLWVGTAMTSVDQAQPQPLSPAQAIIARIVGAEFQRRRDEGKPASPQSRSASP